MLRSTGHPLPRGGHDSSSPIESGGREQRLAALCSPVGGALANAAADVRASLCLVAREHGRGCGVWLPGVAYPGWHVLRLYV